MKIPNKSNISIMPYDIAIEKIPYIVLKLLNSAEVVTNYENKSDVVCIRFDGKEEYIHSDDFNNASKIAEFIFNGWIKQRNLFTTHNNLSNILDIHRISYNKTKDIYGDKFNDKRKIIFIKGDDTGCGYWRMVLPARYLDEKEYVVDVSTVEVIYEYLMEYDVIFVQRVFNWSSYYVIEKLKKIGKKIIYDIDDNLFGLPDGHPAKKLIGNDEREASSAIMRIVDNIVVTNNRLADALIANVGAEIKDKIKIIPNAIDIDNYPYKEIYPLCSQRNEKPFRVLWTGSATHEYDFHECLDALDKFMIKNVENDIRIMFMGFLPICVRKLLNKGHWTGRVEYVEFRDIETYFRMLYQVNADLGLAPLNTNDFNVCKSNIKWQEYTLAGVPTVASNTSPYSDVIKNGVNGFLASNIDEWFEVIENKYNNRDDDLFKNVTKEAYNDVVNTYNISEVINLWKNIF